MTAWVTTIQSWTEPTPIRWTIEPKSKLVAYAAAFIVAAGSRRQQSKNGLTTGRRPFARSVALIRFWATNPACPSDRNFLAKCIGTGSESASGRKGLLSRLHMPFRSMALEAFLAIPGDFSLKTASNGTPVRSCSIGTVRDRRMR